MSISLHVRHEVTPDRTYAVLQAMERGEDFEHITQSQRQVARLNQLGLLEKSELTALGSLMLAICQQKPNLWGDLTHFLHYTLWDFPSVNGRLGISWTYRQVSDEAWNLGNFDLAEMRESLVSSLVNRAEAEADIDVADFKKEAASLSRDSLRGVEHWLASLVPPTIENDSFNRRNFCPVELMLLAISHTMQHTNADLNLDLLLTPARREAICRLCLLEPAALDRTLDWMLPVYPHIVLRGTTAGAYGRFLRFLKWPTFADLAPR